MGAVGLFLRQASDGALSFWCPGCKCAHQIKVGVGPRPRWAYNGNADAPTFTPSILVRTGHHVPGHAGSQCWCTWADKDEFPDMRCTICHTFVTDGKIRFLDDCTHEMAGQTVPMAEWPS